MTRGHRRRVDARRPTPPTTRSRSGSCSTSCPTCRTCPELPGRGAHADMTGRALAVVAELGADLQPAGWRLTDPAPRASTTAGPGRCSPRTSTSSRSTPRATPARSRSRSPDRGRWPRRSSGRAATGCWPTTAPAASWPRRWPRGCGPRRRRAPPDPRRRPGRAGRRARAAGGAGRPGADRVRLPPAPLGRPAGAPPPPLEWVFAAVHRGRGHPRRALLRRRRTRRRC